MSPGHIELPSREYPLGKGVHYEGTGSLDQQSSLKAEEELVGVVVLVPDEVTLELYDLDLIIVQFTDDLRPPMFGNSGQFLL
jgi:hypothetical protein